MRRALLTLIAILACSFISAGAVYSQYDYYGFGEEEARPAWNIHAGIGFFNGEAKNDTTGIVGIEHESPLGSRTLGLPNSFFTVGIDWFPVSTEAGDTENVLPVLLGYRKYGIFGGTNIFFGAAIGARWSSDDIPELQIDDGFDFAWGLNVGVDITPTFFSQLRYLAGSNPGDDGLFTVELGLRF